VLDKSENLLFETSRTLLKAHTILRHIRGAQKCDCEVARKWREIQARLRAFEVEEAFSGVHA
jgi:hypothetical protein